MKKITIFLFMLILSATTFGQQINPTPSLTKQDYLDKSKKQKKAAWILLGGGAALVVTGIVFPKGESKGFTGSYYGISNVVEEYENDGIKAAIGLTGAVSMLGSIPLFLASGKNKRKAMNLSFKNESAPQITKIGFAYRTIPSLNLRIGL